MHFPRELREDVARCWRWTRAVGAFAYRGSEEELADEVVEARQGVIRGEPAGLLDEELVRGMQAVCSRHGLDRIEAARQLDALVPLHRGCRFDTFRDLDRLLDAWPLAHGRLVVELAGLGQSWRRPMFDDMWRAGFLFDRFVRLPEEIGEGHLWIPEDELAASGVARAEIGAGPPREAFKMVLWKQAVRIRERLVRSIPLVEDLPRRFRRPYKSWWFGMLEMLDEVERREYDLWTTPVELSRGQRAKVFLQTWLTRATFKRA